ncbi:Conserved_hypothetical protein [Hexamita inflata]|uniref:Uncharacterized protein n=1 Tax=Hexamita inflata TaxID=28002 RepID=A0AA86UP81_9EUKA|nr:Conserved hypothetical protein [Hexamita inflata]
MPFTSNDARIYAQLGVQNKKMKKTTFKNKVQHMHQVLEERNLLSLVNNDVLNLGENNETDAEKIKKLYQAACKQIEQLNIQVKQLQNQQFEEKQLKVQSKNPILRQILLKYEKEKNQIKKQHLSDNDKNAWMIRFIISKQAYELDVAIFNAPDARGMHRYLQYLQNDVLQSQSLINTEITAELFKKRLISYKIKHNIDNNIEAKGIISVEHISVYKTNKILKNVGEQCYLEKTPDAELKTLTVYMFNPIHDNYEPLPLVFHDNNSEFNKNIQLNVQKMQKYLEQNNYVTYGCIQTEREPELNIDEFLKKKTRNILSKLYKNEDLIPVMDPRTLLYNIYIAQTEKTVNLNFNAEGKQFDFQELIEIFSIEPRCFDKRSQLSYMLPYQVYSAANIKYLLNNQNQPEDILPLLYFFLVYPLTCLFSQIDEIVYQKMLTLSLSTFIKLLPIARNAEAQNLTIPFPSKLIAECIFTLSFILTAINYNESVSFAALSCFKSRCFFNDLRITMQSNVLQNRSTNLFDLVNRKMVLDYCFESTGMKKPKSFIGTGSIEMKKTTVFKQSRILKDSEINQIENLSKAIIQTIQGQNNNSIVLEFIKEMFELEIKEDIYEKKQEQEDKFVKPKDKKFSKETSQSDYSYQSFSK